MDADFEKCERGYLKKRAKDVRPDAEERRQMERIKAAKKAAAEDALDSWDYAVPEIVTR